MRAAFPDDASSLVDRALRAAVSTTIGLGVWSATYAFALLSVGPRAQMPKDAVLAAAGAAVFFSYRAQVRQPANSRPCPAPRWLWLAFGIAAGTAAAVFVHDTCRFPDGGYDAFQTWNLRARFLARAGERFSDAFSPHMEFWSNQDYPWLVPGIVAQGFVLAGERALIPVAVAALFGALAVLIPMFSLARTRGTGWALLAGIAILTTPCFAVFVAHQESDVPLSVYICGTVAVLLLAQNKDAYSPRLVLLAGLLAGLGAWTKNEGILYVLCFTAALIIRTRSWRIAGRFMTGAFPLLALAAYFKIAFAPPNELLRFSTLAGVAARAVDVHRWIELFVLSLRRIVYFQDFALWVVAECVIVAISFRRFSRTITGTAFVLVSAAYALIYVLQPHPLGWLYAHSVERIFIQVWPATVLITVLDVSKGAERLSATELSSQAL
jgi:hypothetical protein